jgi:hypothetical protein
LVILQSEGTSFGIRDSVRCGNVNDSGLTDPIAALVEGRGIGRSCMVPARVILAIRSGQVVAMVGAVIRCRHSGAMMVAVHFGGRVRH